MTAVQEIHFDIDAELEQHGLKGSYLAFRGLNIRESDPEFEA